jgi:hypothetical protein
LTGTPAVVVGVVDTGIRYTHQDLAGNMWGNPGEIPGNGIDDDSNGYVDDVHGIDAITQSGNPMDDNNHGSHCAGTIAAVAGNAGPQVGVAYHARLMALKFMNVVAVAAIDRNGNLASFSSYGASNVDLGAPGVSILSCTAASDTSYGSLDGTSMAAPRVAGVAALLKSLHPTAGVMELKNRLLASASPLPALSGRQEFPEIAVEQPLGTNLADADTTDFGLVAAGSKASLTFTIKNTRTANLTGVTITKSGPNATDFTVTANPAALVGGPDGTTSFTVRFAPSAAGIRTAALHLASNDPDENPFDINLTGIGAALPEIAVEQPAGIEIPDGGRVSFGAMLVSVWGASSSLTVTISNSGGSDLIGLEITKGGNNPSEFTVSGPATTTVAGGGSTTFTVTFTPSEFGSRSRTATLQIWSNDADENPCDLDLFGEVFLAPDIVVEQPAGTSLTAGSAIIAFGNLEVGSTSGPITVTVRNTGTRSLNDLVLTKDGRNNGEFTVGNLGATSVAVGGSTTFTLSATPGATGPRVAALHLASDDPDESPFDIELRVGAGTDQEFWRQRHFGSPAKSGDGADLNDFERDGIPNLLEFAFDLHPKQSSAGVLPQPQVIGNHLVISFIQAERISGITYGAESSPTLLPGSWLDVTDTGVAPQHIFSVPIGTKPSLFLRLKVSSP